VTHEREAHRSAAAEMQKIGWGEYPAASLGTHSTEQLAVNGFRVFSHGGFETKDTLFLFQKQACFSDFPAAPWLTQ
jgi:hypothetical protein